MLPAFPVILAAYDPEWPRMAAHYAEGLRVLGTSLRGVHHIGSTSVPGLVAKPIIDLMPLVTTLADLDRLRPRVEALGYAWHGEYGVAGRRYCTLSDEDGRRLVQLHFYAAESTHAVRHIAFRDYLCTHPDVARAYEAEKRRARDLHPGDSNAYSAEKSAFVRDNEAEALIWFAEQQSSI